MHVPTEKQQEEVMSTHVHRKISATDNTSFQSVVGGLYN